MKFLIPVIFGLLLTCPNAALSLDSKKLAACNGLLSFKPLSENHFERLGFAAFGQGADVDTVSDHFNKATRVYHPDNQETGDTVAMQNLNEARESLDTEEKICKYRSSVGCMADNKLVSLYNGAAFGPSVKLREKQKAFADLRADLQKSRIDFQTSLKITVPETMPETWNDGMYNYYNALALHKYLKASPEQRPALLEDALNSIKGELEHDLKISLDYGMGASYHRKSRNIKSPFENILSFFLSPEIDNSIRIKIISILLRESYAETVTIELFKWLALRMDDQTPLINAFINNLRSYRSATEKQRLGAYNSIKSNFKDAEEKSLANYAPDSAKATIELITGVIGSVRQDTQFDLLYRGATSLFVTASTSSLGRGYGSYLSWHSAGGAREKLIESGVAHYGSMDALVGHLDPNDSGQRYFALIGFEEILEEIKEGKPPGPEFELLIWSTFGSKTPSELLDKEIEKSKGILKGIVHDNKLFDNDFVLGLTEKYPAFGKWANQMFSGAP